MMLTGTRRYAMTHRGIPDYRRHILCAMVVSAAACGPVIAAPPKTPKDPKAELRRLLTQLPQKSAVCSAKIVDLQTGNVLIEVNPDKKLIPASNQKLWVLAAAAADLGASFNFRTRLGLKGGDVWVIGDGDPGFGDPALCQARGESVTAELERWAKTLAARGLTRLSGRLHFDDSIFDAERTHASWSASDRLKWYGAPVGGLNLNDNCVEISVWPGKASGEPVGWSVVPPNDVVQVVNRCTSGGKGQPVLDRPGADMRYVITGRCNKRWEFPSVAAPDPTALFAASLQHALEGARIEAEAPVQVGRLRLADGNLPLDVEIVAEHRTPLADVMARVGKNSQNLFAEALFKRLGYESCRRTAGRPPVGSWETGTEALLDFAARAGISATAADIHDGSGLSRDNRLSAAQAVDLLAYMHRHAARELFAQSLAVAGKDGSLEKRMKDVRGVVRAKTGYIGGVRSLSGYVESNSGRTFAFSILFNGIKGGTAPFNKIHDEVCRLLAAWPD